MITSGIAGLLSAPWVTKLQSFYIHCYIDRERDAKSGFLREASEKIAGAWVENWIENPGGNSHFKRSEILVSKPLDQSGYI